MLDFVIFAITFVVFLLLLVFYLYPGSGSKKTNVPGLDPSDSVEGNIPDILVSGGLHPFLKDLHNTYGPIASFWMGRSLVVSVGTPELFKELQQTFNKPDEIFSLYKSLVGDRSLLLLNGVEGRKRREIWESFLDVDQLLPAAIKCMEEFSGRISMLPKGQHIPVHTYCRALSMKICLQSAFGNYFHDEQVLKFNRIFETCWSELECQAMGSVAEKDSPRSKRFQEEVSSLKSALRESMLKGSGGKNFLKELTSAGLSEEDAINDGLLFILKFNSLASALTWLICYISSNESVQEKLSEEVKNFLKVKTPKKDDLAQLRYTQQVVNESLRLGSVETWTARCQDLDIELAGYIIPKKTPVILALGVALQSDKIWTQPNQFNPENFSASNKPSQLSGFQPFGSAGKRGCPGSSLASNLMQLLVVTLCSKTVLQAVEGQVVSPVYNICTRPEEEIWITVKKR